MAGGGFVSKPGDKAYPGELTLYVTITCIVAAMGGLIFGYDIGISGKKMIQPYVVGWMDGLCSSGLIFFWGVLVLQGKTLKNSTISIQKKKV